MIEKGDSRRGVVPGRRNPINKVIMTITPEFENFIDTLEDLKRVGGNYHFEARLFKACQNTGKSIEQLTVAEFLQLHANVNREYNEFCDRLTAKNT